MKHPNLRADALLLLAAVLWGAAFVAQRSAMQHMGPLTYNGVRFALGTLALLPVIALRSRFMDTGATQARAAAANPTTTSADSALSEPAALDYASVPAAQHSGLSPCLLPGIAVGFVLFIAAGLQQAGLVHTTASKAGFITGLYVPLVPIFGLLVGQRTSKSTWLGGVMAIAGLYFLSVTWPLDINRGDVLVMFCAMVYAIQVLLIGWLAPDRDPILFAAVQFAVVAIASLVFAVCRETITLGGLRAATWAIVYGGIASVTIAYTLQVVGQRHAPPAHAAIVLSLETVFAAAVGYRLLGERLGRRELLGAALMLAGMLVSQVPRLLAPAARKPIPS